MLKGVLPLLVLDVVEDADAYGWDVLRELRDRAGVSVGDASVYGTLQRLHDRGHVRSYVDESGPGPKRRYYSITDAGRTALADDRRTWSTVTRAVNMVLNRKAELNA